jgi:hypothetical protein
MSSNQADAIQIKSPNAIIESRPRVIRAHSLRTGSFTRFSMKRQNVQGTWASKPFIRLCPILAALIFIFYLEYQSWKANTRRQLILNTPREAICETNDVVSICQLFIHEILVSRSADNVRTSGKRF